MCSGGCQEFWSQEAGFAVAEMGPLSSFDTGVLGTLMGEADTSAVYSGSVNRPRGIQPA